MFGRLDLPLDFLVFSDEINLPALHLEKRLALVLVDHNILCMEQKYLGSCVVEIIDHHKVQVLYSSFVLCIAPEFGH